MLNFEERENEFSWSKSRHNKFNGCLRDYYYHYYASWGGYYWEEAPRTRELYMMKNLSSIPMWIGENVHWHINWILNRLFKSKSPVSIEGALNRLHKNMEIDWHISKTGHYLGEPGKVPGLVEHYYDELSSDKGFDEAYELAERSLMNFYKKSIYNQLLEKPSIELLAAEEFEYSDIRGIKVWVVCDVVLLWDGCFYIIDWKTGKTINKEGLEFQLAIYAIHLLNKIYQQNDLKLNLEDIQVVSSHLFVGEEYTHSIEEDKLKIGDEKIVSSANKMKALLRNPEENIAFEEDFPMTKNTDLCIKCNFRKACEFSI